MTDTRATGWMDALDVPSAGQAADAVTALTRDADDICARLGRMHDLIARAGDAGLAVYAAMAQNSVWQLVDALDGAASDLLRTVRGYDHG
jgi:hypothetical protein